MSFFQELKRRNVFRVGVAYAVAAWVLLQLTDVVGEILELPEWGGKLILLALVVGFIPALIIAWAFELTPDGVKRESEIDRSQSIAPQTGKKLNTVILVLMAVAIAYLLLDKFYLSTFRVDLPAQTVENAEVAVETPEPVAASRPVRQSVAVLPFTTRSSNEEDVYFSDGMHDDLLTQLAKISSLKVISRTSVLEYRDTTKNMRQIGAELGVASILEGAVQRAGQKVRINMQLIDAESDEHLWAETYDRELSVDNLFAIQSEIAQAITTALQATLSAEERNQLERKLTNNLEALEAYRRAKILAEDFIAEDLNQAEMELRHALDLDPQFAVAHALLAHVYLSRWWNIERNPDFLTTARDEIDRARQIDPELPEIAIEEGYYHYWGFLEYQQALDVLEPLLPLYPNNNDLLEVLSYVNRRFGRFDASLDYARQAETRAPRDLSILYTIGETYSGLRRWPEAQAYLDKMLAIDPNNWSGHSLRATLLAGRDGDFQGAARYTGIASRGLAYEHYFNWVYQLMAGNFDGAMSAAQAVSSTDLFREPAPTGLMQGLTLRMFGDPEAAMPLLQEAELQLSSSLETAPDRYELLEGLCRVHGGLGWTQEAMSSCGSAIAALPDDAFANPDRWITLASGLAMGGALEQAMDVLGLLAESPVRPPTNVLRADPRLKDLRELEDWQRLMAALDSNT